MNREEKRKGKETTMNGLKTRAAATLSMIALGATMWVSAGVGAAQAQPPRAYPYPAPPSQCRPGGYLNVVRLQSLNNSLLYRVERFLDVFEEQKDYVPEGCRIYFDAQRLHESSRDLRRSLVQNEHPEQILRRFADLERDCARLTNRVNRIAEGGWGPNISAVNDIGRICILMRQTIENGR